MAVITAAPERATIADRLLDAVAPILGGGPVPFAIRAWDDSVAGPEDAPVLTVRSPAAVRRLIFSPGELGLARAFVTGEIDVEGDLARALAVVWDALRSDGRRGSGRRALLDRRVVRSALGLGLLGPPPKPPESEARLSGRLHSPGRDRQVISHHYDLSNDFYRLVLDETMAYSCGYWTSTASSYGLHDAQLDKLDLVCRKLDLAPGARLLDVGCGWGSLSLHAAMHFGATVQSVTLSSEQAAYVRDRSERLGLSDRVEVLFRDYRAIPVGEYDAVASIEMGEHVGRENYAAFTKRLASHLRPQGRLLIQQMSRPADSPGGGPFVERYIAPDMFMRPVGETVALIENAGLEVRDVEALREHYARTIWAWYARLEERIDAATELVGEEVVRVWRLYLAGIALGFERGRTGVDQILAVRRTRDGASGLAPTRTHWRSTR
jgi:cyclopropane-fatty-acyl-phospholipid synthase